jgi:hypothetical protein
MAAAAEGCKGEGGLGWGWRMQPRLREETRGSSARTRRGDRRCGCGRRLTTVEDDPPRARPREGARGGGAAATAGAARFVPLRWTFAPSGRCSGCACPSVDGLDAGAKGAAFGARPCPPQRAYSLQPIATRSGGGRGGALPARLPPRATEVEVGDAKGQFSIFGAVLADEMHLFNSSAAIRPSRETGLLSWGFDVKKRKVGGVRARPSNVAAPSVEALS